MGLHAKEEKESLMELHRVSRRHSAKESSGDLCEWQSKQMLEKGALVLPHLLYGTMRGIILGNLLQSKL